MEIKTEFSCSNCGYCCTDPSTQINITLIEIKYLSDYLKMSVKELFEKDIISFIPFISTEDFSVFDVEFGMKRPCPLYKDNKCTIYEARPMNCRIFPYWFITNDMPDEVECTKDVKPDPITFFKYRMYERMIGEMILKQSKDTEEFIKKIGTDQKIDFRDNEKVKKLVKLMKRRSRETDDKAQKIARKLMKMAESLVDKKRLLKKIPLIEEEIKKQDYKREIEIILNSDAIIDGEITNVEIRHESDSQQHF